MKIYKILLIFNNIFYTSMEDKLIPEVKIEEYEDKPVYGPKEIKLTYKSLNGIFFFFGIILTIFYFCNELLVDTLDIIDAIFFCTILFLNLIINWMTKPKSSNKDVYSKKRNVSLLVNFLYICGLLTGYTLGYLLNKIDDCNLFTGAKDCHSHFTLFQYITVFLMFFTLLLKICF
jgi:hypothetical protein